MCGETHIPRDMYVGQQQSRGNTHPCNTCSKLSDSPLFVHCLFNWLKVKSKCSEINSRACAVSILFCLFHSISISIVGFITCQCNLVKYCKFGTILNRMFRDKLICGVKEPRIQRQPLAEPDLTFEKILN